LRLFSFPKANAQAFSKLIAQWLFPQLAHNQSAQRFDKRRVLDREKIIAYPETKPSGQKQAWAWRFFVYSAFHRN
jgi:hypothetical protein